jgi:GntR family transcriptional regulator, vanillate catabolism transcriptional regulator
MTVFRPGSTAAELAPLTRVRLVDEIAERIRGYILDGALMPGQQLRQVELAERLGVSRTPLREAFRVLERDGFVHIANGNQTVEVVDFTTQDLIELYEVREVVDGLAARCSSRLGLSREVAASLSDCLSTMERATEPLDISGYNDAHVTFHTAIVIECGNRRVCDLLPIVRLTSSSSVTRITRKLYTEGSHWSLDEILQRQFMVGNSHHRAIFDAVLERNPAKAEKLARLHISTTIRNIQRLARGPAGEEGGAKLDDQIDFVPAPPHTEARA